MFVGVVCLCGRCVLLRVGYGLVLFCCYGGGEVVTGLLWVGFSIVRFRIVLCVFVFYVVGVYSLFLFILVWSLLGGFWFAGVGFYLCFLGCCWWWGLGVVF